MYNVTGKKNLNIYLPVNELVAKEGGVWPIKREARLTIKTNQVRARVQLW